MPLVIIAPYSVPSFSASFASYSQPKPTWSTVAGFGLDTLAGFPPLPPTIWTVNVTTYVTTVLASVDGYLSWRTQFTGFVIMH